MMKAVISLILCSLLLAGCGAAQPPQASPAFTEPPAATEPVEAAPATATPEPIAPEASPLPEYFITLYAPNEDVSGFIYASLELEEVSAASLSLAFKDAGVLNGDAALNSIVQNGSRLDLDVNEAFVQQLNSYGTSGECYMLGSVVNTLLEAYDADSLYITANGQLIETGHNIYDFSLSFYS